MTSKPNTNNKESVPRDYVAEMAILTSVIDKENRNNTLYENYKINPRTIDFITEKPNIDPSKYTFAKLTDKEDRTDLELSSTLDRYRAVPRKKQVYPITDYQKIGWFHDAENVKSFEKFNKTGNREMTFDEAYWRAKGYSQFSKKTNIK